MIRPLLALPLALALFACAGTPAKEAPPPAQELETFAYEVAVPALPDGASELVLTIDLPAADPLRVQSLHGLVGNAPFEVPLTHEKDVSFSNEHVSLSLAWIPGTHEQSGTLRLTTHGKPLELALRFALPAAPAGAGEVEKALLASTKAASDGRAIEGLVTRFERVR